MKLEIQEAKVVHIKPGKYRGAFKDLIPIEGKGGNFVPLDGTASRDCFRWDFLGIEEEAKGKILSGISSQVVNPMSKSHQWLKVLLGRGPKTAETIETDSLKGKEATLVIEDVELGSGIASRVVDVLPLK